MDTKQSLRYKGSWASPSPTCLYYTSKKMYTQSIDQFS